MIINALNGVSSDTLILQIIIQQELEKLTKILQRDDFKDIHFPVKTRDLHKIEKKNCMGISVFGYENKSVDDKFSKPFKSYLGKDAVYNFVSSMIEESKYCSDVMKKHFDKELVITKKDNEDFEYSTKFWVCDNDYIDGDVKVKYNCHITGKYRGSAHRDCNNNVK